jgi:hypothetical protein
MEQRQIPRAVENTRPTPPAYVNNSALKPHVQPPKNDENSIASSRKMPQVVNRQAPPEKKREIIVANSKGEAASQRSFGGFNPEANRNIKPANIQHVQVEQRKPAPAEKVVPERTMEAKRVDPRPDVQRQPIPDKISQVNENHRGGVSDVPVPISKPNGRNEGRGIGR